MERLHRQGGPGRSGPEQCGGPGRGVYDDHLRAGSILQVSNNLVDIDPEVRKRSEQQRIVRSSCHFREFSHSDGTDGRGVADREQALALATRVTKSQGSQSEHQMRYLIASDV
jgi:hypothetical protein